MLKDTILERRSIRKYKDEKVDRETLEEILMYSLMGPSYANSHPVQFLIIEDKESLKKLSEIETFGTRYIAEVPQVILILVDRELAPTWIEEGSVVASYLQLLAQENGLNTCWVDLKEGKTSKGDEIQAFLRELFDIPKKFSSLCMIPIGYGNEKVKKREKFDIATKIHNEKF
ncbi:MULTISPECIES: nitroreductase family protein [Peptoniphilus]|uniref:nitroreductase family protein n=1 Tax=Peptoniphilus TaxID=162289 RepID=UPI0001DA9A82|nr:MULTISPECIES: nitroreductase family protein [Peptoniphilus]EFI41948.1 nitroreductase family protein [Peptoniphilus sp. oral taxon 386 str. F0131]